MTFIQKGKILKKGVIFNKKGENTQKKEFYL